ncbi:hypothetical protein QE152_g30439 [Popillia japonica]|uniref:Uncharacterized protein n=1 Tax=Popillia japonica TaxID=7064 RepID=A0AAW1JEM1_POPJA
MLSVRETSYNKERKKKVDDMQQKYKCCGPDEPANITETTYLPSCCATLDKGQCLNPYEQTCVDAMLTYAISIYCNDLSSIILQFVISLVVLATGGAAAQFVISLVVLATGGAAAMVVEVTRDD